MSGSISAETAARNSATCRSVFWYSNSWMRARSSRTRAVSDGAVMARCSVELRGRRSGILDYAASLIGAGTGSGICGRVLSIFDRAGTGLPLAIAVAVAWLRRSGRPFAGRGAAQLISLQRHQRRTTSQGLPAQWQPSAQADIAPATDPSGNLWFPGVQVLLAEMLRWPDTPASAGFRVIIQNRADTLAVRQFTGRHWSRLVQHYDATWGAEDAGHVRLNQRHNGAAQLRDLAFLSGDFFLQLGENLAKLANEGRLDLASCRLGVAFLPDPPDGYLCVRRVSSTSVVWTARH